MKSKALIIDGFSLAFRAFYALPLLTNANKIYTNAVYGFAMMLQKALDTVQPDYVVVAFDRPEPTFRHESYEEYKGTREKPPEELIGQFDLIHDLLDAMNIAWLEVAGYEADDLLGSLGRHFTEQNIDTALLTGDRDAYQLITPHIKVLYTQRKGISEMQIADEAFILEKYNLKPAQLIDVKALMGDPSDNIPGVPGIGEKTAMKLIQEFHSLENLLEHNEQVTPKRARENLVTYRDQALLSYHLAKIDTTLPIAEPLEDFKHEEVNYEKLREFYQTYALKTLLDRLPSPEISVSTSEQPVPATPEAEMITDSKLCLNQIKNGEVLALSFRESTNTLEEAPFTFGFLFTDGTVSLYAIDDEKELQQFTSVLKTQSFTVWNVKQLAHQLDCFFPLAEDAMLQSYLLNPGQTLSPGAMYQEYFPKGQFVTATDSAETELYQLKELLPFLRETLQERSLWDLYRDIELPLARVLYLMENAGIVVRLPVLQELSRDFEQQMDQLQAKIFALSDAEFNLNSPKQLAEILFEKMGLPGGRKTKSGYSTDAETLDRLLGEHEIIPLILQYRSLAKFKGTYLDGLIPLIDPKDEKLHTTFHQTVTTTGRLSSSDPNLQNIPTRSEEGRQIRMAFYPTVPNWSLISADYSQIELRILAHLSQDEHFIDAYRNNQDIHRRTASEVFGVPFEEVSAALRDQAKAVNFGIVYGISDYGLSTQLRITRKEAKVYIDRFFEEFPAIRSYQKKLVEDAKENGYVTTIFQRRRYLPEIQSKNYNLRSFGERAALNTPIQGSAADLIKIAMIRLQKAIEDANLQGRMLLQVHDELVCESPPEEAEAMKKLMKTTMEQAITLTVPIVVEVSSGNNWYNLKK